MNDSTAVIQRVPELEARAGIELEGIFATIEESDYDLKSLNVNFDVTSPRGSIQGSLSIHVSAYNESGQLVGTDSTTIWGDEFVGIESVSERVTLYDEPAVVLIFPQQRS